MLDKTDCFFSQNHNTEWSVNYNQDPHVGPTCTKPQKWLKQSLISYHIHSSSPLRVLHMYLSISRLSMVPVELLVIVVTASCWKCGMVYFFLCYVYKPALFSVNIARGNIPTWWNLLSLNYDMLFSSVVLINQHIWTYEARTWSNLSITLAMSLEWCKDNTPEMPVLEDLHWHSVRD